MPRYIDVDLLREYWLFFGQNENIYNTNDFLNGLDNTPTADVIPVVHGRWVLDKNAWQERSGVKRYLRRCSACGDIQFQDENYCPRCGAKMDEEG